MRTYIAILVLTAAGTWLVTPWVRGLALRFGGVDLPGPRKVHQTPMPRWGGIALLIGFALPWPGFYIRENLVTTAFQDFEKLFLALVVAGVLMVALGAWDDRRPLRALPKLVVQAGAALVMYFGGYQIDLLTNPLGGSVHLGWLSLPVTLLWIVGLTNAMNLLDGVDGLATGVAACIALALAFINSLQGNVLVVCVTLSLAGACLGFLPHNFAPARIFLGDSGSLFLGIMLAGIGIISLFKAATASFILAPLILFGLPLFDTASVFLGRLFRGAPVFKGDQTHVHHRLLKLGWDHRQVAVFLYSVSLMLGGMAVYLAAQRSPRLLLVGGTVGLVLIALFRATNQWRVLSEENRSKGSEGEGKDEC